MVSVWKDLLETGRRVAEEAGVDVSGVTARDVEAYMRAVGLVEESTEVRTTLRSDYLALHLLAEIAHLKRRGYRITRDLMRVISWRALNEAELAGIDAELRLAEARRDWRWIRIRESQLKERAKDSALPKDLRSAYEAVAATAAQVAEEIIDSSEVKKWFAKMVK